MGNFEVRRTGERKVKPWAGCCSMGATASETRLWRCCNNWASERNVRADSQLGRKRRATVAITRLLAAGIRARRVQILRKAVPTSQNLTKFAFDPLGISNSGFHADTAQVSSYQRGQGGLQAQIRSECQHHHARPR